MVLSLDPTETLLDLGHAFIEPLLLELGALHQQHAPQALGTEPAHELRRPGQRRPPILTLRQSQVHRVALTKFL